MAFDSSDVIFPGRRLSAKLPFPPPGEYNTHNGPSTPAKEGDTDRPHRASDGKLRGRSKRSSDPSPAGDNEIEVTPTAADVVNVISICGLNRRAGDRVLSKYMEENGHLHSQSPVTEKRALEGKVGKNGTGHREILLTDGPGKVL